MNRFILLLLSCIVSFTYAFPGASPDKKITVKVLDLKTRKPIENASVFVDIVRAGAADVTRQKKMTDKNGECNVTVATGMDIGYTLTARKDGYFNCFSKDPESPLVSGKSFMSVISSPVTLYLTADSAHLRDYYYSITPHMPVDTLVEQLKKDRFSPSTMFYLPDLKWEEIPKLLKIAKDTSKITKFTENPYSSIKLEKCYLGVFAMWLIESIRISEGKTLVEPVKRFPSLNPVIIDKARGESVFSSFFINYEMIEIAFEAYANWWESYKNADPVQACKINPLEKTGLSWGENSFSINR